jgi:hypothetical protein
MANDLTEFTSKVTRQDTMLCFPLGESLGVALERFGFTLDQAVVVRFAEERLEIRPLSTPETVRDKLREKAGELRAFREKIRGLANELPSVSDEELEEESTLEGELLGMLECLLSDDLDPAIQKLEGVDQFGPAPPFR